MVSSRQGCVCTYVYLPLPAIVIYTVLQFLYRETLLATQVCLVLQLCMETIITYTSRVHMYTCSYCYVYVLFGSHV